MKAFFKNRHFAGLLYGSLLLLLIQVVGTLGYHYIGRPNASWIDSFYMTFITIATIGFGEIVDLTHHPLGRLFRSCRHRARPALGRSVFAPRDRSSQP